MNKEYAQLLGQRINDVCKHVGGKRALTKLAQLNEQLIYRYINGQNIPNTEIIVNMANASNVSIEWLMTGHGEMFKKSDKILSDNLIDLIEIIERECDQLSDKINATKKAQIISMVFDQTRHNDQDISKLIKNIFKLFK